LQHISGWASAKHLGVGHGHTDISSEGKAAATEVVSGARYTRLRSGHLPPQRVWDFDDDSPPETPTRAPVLNAAGMRTRRSAMMEESLRPTASTASGAVPGVATRKSSNI
jgi:hypothetical protein